MIIICTTKRENDILIKNNHDKIVKVPNVMWVVSLINDITFILILINFAFQDEAKTMDIGINQFAFFILLIFNLIADRYNNNTLCREKRFEVKEVEKIICVIKIIERRIVEEMI